MPSLDAGEERRLVLRVRVSAQRTATSVANVSLDYEGIGGASVRAERELRVSMGVGYRAREASIAASAVLDSHLAQTLDAAGEAVRVGDARAATAAFEEHAELIEGRVEHRRNGALQARARTSRRMARAMEALLPRATPPQRRQVALALGGLAVEIGR